jgi:MYXO-CTERM domain-containing protein
MGSRGRTIPVVVLVLMAAAGGGRANAQGFTDVTQESGFATIRATRPADWWLSGFSLIDLDGDGDLDLTVGSHGGSGSALAASNDGHGHFTLLPSAPWNGELHVAIDLNEDGKIDFVTTEDDGGGRWWFNESTPGAINFRKTNLSDEQSRTQSLIDMNRDGMVDWFVADDAPFGPPYKIRLYLGDGKGGFGPGLPQPTLDGMPLPFDADGDGDIDVIGLVGNPPSSPVIPTSTKLYRNDGKMNFQDVTVEAGLAAPGLFILGAADTDQDGDLDLIALVNGTYPVAIYVNNGSGIFARKADAITAPATGRAEYGNIGAATVTDLDNDGVADILAAGLSFFHVLRGTGGGNFSFANQTWGGIANIASLPDSGFAFGDIDGDGDLDLLGYKSGNDKNMNVYRNDLPRQNWVKVRPIGLPGNHAATGAKIRVYEASSTKLLWYEEIQIHAKQVEQNYYNFSDTERHFGLGSRSSVDVAVQFYPSNKVVKQSGVAANSTVRIDEKGTGTVVTPMDGGSGAIDARDGAGGAVDSAGTAGETGMPAGNSDASHGGCSCRTPPGATDSSPWALLATILAFLRIRRARPRSTGR